jgi:pseudouridine kinase
MNALAEPDGSVDRFGFMALGFVLFVGRCRLEAGMTPSPKLLAIGGAHIDRRGQLTVPHMPGASNPGRMREEVGGGVFNAARNAAQLGVKVDFLSVRGGDLEGDLVAREIAAAGFNDLSSIFLDRQTASYTAIIDQDGDVITALADMDIYETALPRIITRRKTRDAIADCKAVLTDANMPEAAIRALVGLSEGRPVFAIAISPAKGLRLRNVLDRIDCVFMNAREAQAIAGRNQLSEAIEQLAIMGLQRAVISQGDGPVILMQNGAVLEIAPPKAASIADVTGAGDALAGVTLAALMQGSALDDAVRLGMRAATLTVASPQAVIDLRAAGLTLGSRHQQEHA